MMGPGGTTTPGNAADRARFDALGDVARMAATERARALYDGTRTIASCWSRALAETEADEQERRSFGSVIADDDQEAFEEINARHARRLAERMAR